MGLLFWFWMWCIATAGVIAISIVVSVFLDRNNIASILGQHETNGASQWLVKEIEGADHVVIGLKKSGEIVGGVNITCKNGHALRVGQTGWL